MRLFIVTLAEVVLVLVSVSTMQATDYQFVRSIGSYGTDDGQFYFPRGIIILPSGNLWVSDYNNDRIEEFANDGTFVRSIDNPYFPLPMEPTGMSRDPSGNIWVASLSSKITEFTPNGAIVQQFGSSGSGNGQFYDGTYGVTVDHSGNVWAADAYNNRIQEFTSTGTFIKAFASYGTKNGQLTFPEDVALDSSENVWVADTANNRIVEFTNNGTFVKNVGEGMLYGPCSIEFDSSENIWVADTGNDRMVELTSDGTFVGAFGSDGSSNSRLSRPTSFTWDSSGNMWIADGWNNRIVEFAPIPEPSTIMLLLIGVTSFLIFRWKRAS